jgi:MerR family transcriptional regulator, copper efflux regulator
MRIGELAQRLHVNPRTLRYYESIGLLAEPARTESGYRDYSEGDLERVQFIKTAQRLGLSLDEIKEILAFKDRGELPCDYVLSVIEREAEDLNRRIREMKKLRDDLTVLKDKAQRIPRARLRRDACVCHIIENQELLATQG